MEGIYTPKCLRCSASLEYNIEKQGWMCEYCHTLYKTAEFFHYEELGEKMKVEKYTCPDCGSEIVVGDGNAVTKCTYCRNSAIVRERIEGIYKPQKIVPFKLTKEDIKERLKEEFKEEIDENEISMAFVPFWVFGIDITFGEIFFGGKAQRPKLKAQGFPVDGINEIDDFSIFRVFPYEDEEKEFVPEYISGIPTFCYNTDKYKAYESAINQITELLEIKYPFSYTKNAGAEYCVNDISYVLFPVYIFEHKGIKIYVNGSNGKISRYDNYKKEILKKTEFLKKLRNRVDSLENKKPFEMDFNAAVIVSFSLMFWSILILLAKWGFRVDILLLVIIICVAIVMAIKLGLRLIDKKLLPKLIKMCELKINKVIKELAKDVERYVTIE